MVMDQDQIKKLHPGLIKCPFGLLGRSKLHMVIR